MEHLGITTWDPPRTRVFAAGLLVYEDGEHWPTAGRRDEVLIGALGRRGVRAEKMRFLRDEQLTCAAFQRELRAHLSASSPGETLLFYYAGHGVRSKAGQACLLLRDGVVPMAELFRWIEAEFRGEAAVLAADCCYSGALAHEAQMRAGRVAYAAWASTLASQRSTSLWTFTDCLIDAIDGALPLDAPGPVRLGDLARHAERRMAFHAGQLPAFGLANGFPAGLALGLGLPRVGRVGEQVEALDRGQWRRAEILADEGERLRVRHAGHGHEADRWASAGGLRPWRPRLLPLGAAVEAKSLGKWYPGKVVAVRHGLHLIQFDGYDTSWDEWAGPDRLRLPGGKTGKPAGAKGQG